MQQSHKNSMQTQTPSQIKSLQIYLHQTQPIKECLQSLNTPRYQQNLQQRQFIVKKSGRSHLKRRTPSQILKSNILKMKYNRRMDQLKELTQHNVQMFYRIQAQSSHYQFRSLHRQLSCDILHTRLKPPLPSDRNIQSRTNSRCESAKSNLKSRCYSLKQSLAKEIKSSCNTGEMESNIIHTKISKQVSIQIDSRLESKLSSYNNKQNLVVNRQAKVGRKIFNQKNDMGQTERKVLAKKLTVRIPIKDMTALKQGNMNDANNRVQVRNRVESSFARLNSDYSSELNCQRRLKGLTERPQDKTLA